MSIITDIQFVPRLSAYVQRLKHFGDYDWGCRCPFCGDSKKNKSKVRGGFYRKDDKILFNCFNCGVGTTLGKVIEHCSDELYKEYRLASFAETQVKEDHISFKPSRELPKLKEVDSSLDSIKCLKDLPEDHPAVKYILNRDIPKNLLSLFYFAPKFKAFTNSLIKKFTNESLQNDYPRLIIPYFNEHGKMFAFAARAFGDEQPKYYTIKINEDEEKVYGRERLDYSKRIYVVEGQIDSMLLPNCIAVSGSSFDTPYIQGIKTNCTLVPDNEPRNSDIVKQYRKYIVAGYNVCMLPETFKFKDINEAIQGGMQSDDIIKLIDDNTYQGIRAELKFIEWNKSQ